MRFQSKKTIYKCEKHAKTPFYKLFLQNASDEILANNHGVYIICIIYHNVNSLMDSKGSARDLQAISKYLKWDSRFLSTAFFKGFKSFSVHISGVGQPLRELRARRPGAHRHLIGTSRSRFKA